MSNAYSTANCPIRKDIDHIQKLSTDMVQTLRTIRNKLYHCPECEAYGQCPLITEFRAQIHSAIQDVVDEWNLAEIIT